MVNKQYTIQHQYPSYYHYHHHTNRSSSKHQSKRYSPPPLRDLSAISETPNPSTNNNQSTSVTTTSSALCGTPMENDKNKFDCITTTTSTPWERKNNTCYSRNITSLPIPSISNKSQSTDDHSYFDEGNFAVKDLTINDIGRFQYILQMDKEMGCSTDTVHHIPSKDQNSNSSTINSTGSTHFWKATSSESPITTTGHRRRRHEIQKHLKNYWKYTKWPLFFITGIILFACLIFFIIFEQNNTSNSVGNSTKLMKNEMGVLNFTKLNVNSDEILKVSIKNPKISSTLNENNGDIVKVSLNQSEDVTEEEEEEDVMQFSISSEESSTIGQITESSTENHKKSSVTQAIPFRNTQILKIKSHSAINFDDEIQQTTEKVMRSQIEPTKETIQPIGFTSGHQNNFGVPIEEDERILKLLDDELIKSGQSQDNNTRNSHSTTEASIFKVSPTLPALSSKETVTENILKIVNSTDVETCESTSLAICRGILQYDLTMSKNKTKFTQLEHEHFKYLFDSKCSFRAAEFVCSLLEPECRPTQMGVLQPCKRICKSILEPCASIIASSEILTMIFDCDRYPDSSDRNVCEDPTRRGRCFDNEFKCLDSSCIPLQWRCDNIKDCSLGEDEENCLFCEHEEFRCQSNDKCIPDKWRCDQYDDCPDRSDEIDCYDYEDDEDISKKDDFNPRIFSFTSILSPDDHSNRSYVTINSEDDKLPDDQKDVYINDESVTVESFDYLNNTDSNEDTRSGNEEIQTGEASGRVVVASRNLANFQDSKEIMMTSDSETDFKYSKINRSDSEVTTQKTDITTFKANLYCPGNQLRCVSGKCITVAQICDKTVDCPDGADEAMCVYKDP